MLTPALKAIKPLELPADRDATFDIRVKPYMGYGDRKPFEMGLTGFGFEATRNLTVDDLTDIRDWINEALAAVEEPA